MANAMPALVSGARYPRLNDLGSRWPANRLGTNNSSDSPASGSVAAGPHGGDAAGEANARERQERSV